MALRAHASLGGPFGFVGASLALAPLRFVEVEVGLGRNDLGLEAGAMSHLMVPLPHGLAVGVGAGLSTGEHLSRCGSFILACGPDWHWDHALFTHLQAEITGYRGMWQWRGYLGAWHLANRAAATCVTSYVDVDLDPSRCGLPERAPFDPYLGGSFGVGF